MLQTSSVVETANDIDGLFSFRILGEVSRDDMQAMAAYMLERFDQYEKVDMLLTFEAYDGAEAGASWGVDTLKSRLKSLTNVRNYVVAGAPKAAARMIETFGTLMPVDGRAFDTEVEAMAFLRAEPLLTRTA